MTDIERVQLATYRAVERMAKLGYPDEVYGAFEVFIDELEKAIGDAKRTD